MSNPDVFSATPTNAGVRRPNKLPLFIVCAVAVMAIAAFGYTLYQRSRIAGAEANQAVPVKLAPSSADELLRDVTASGLIEADKEPTSTVYDDGGATRVVTVADDGSVSVTAPPSSQYNAGPVNQAHERSWQQYDQQVSTVDNERFSTARTALNSPPDAEFSTLETPQAPSLSLPNQPGSSLESSLQSALAAAQAQSAGGSAGASAGGFSAAGNNGGDGGEALDVQYAQSKSAWLSQEPDPAQYLPSGRRAMAAPYEVKTGSVIPAVMIGGINSDLPGTILAQVRENVWDTATGTLLLIPQGARLVGRYDNAITRGQSRVLVAWTRIVYPDASTVDLGAMPGTDQGGFAGFSDKVNNHYFRVFGDALLVSAFSAGVALSQPRDDTATLSNADVATAQLGQQLGQAGIEITKRNLNIQPTLIIRPGYRFNVMVTKDMILTPWVKTK